MTKAAFLADPEWLAQVYGNGRREQFEQKAAFVSEIIRPDSLDAQIALLHDVEVLFSTWGMRELTGAQMDAMPQLRAVFYAAGSVQSFARPLLERGITLVSAWQANAVPVAEFTLAQILLANKGWFRNRREYGAAQSAKQAFSGPGNYGETVALLGAGSIGRILIGLLKPFQLHVIVYDPFLDAAGAQNLGVEKVSLPEAFERGFVVSNHMADKPETEGIIDGDLLSRLRPGAVFINTGRGKTVRHDDLYAALLRRPDLTALLDVTDPEPLPPDSPFFALPNAQISTHIAGSIQDEVLRLADYCLADFDRYLCGETLRYAVTLEMLATLA